MILKKPYAFLIRHFRLIHIILTALSIYAVYKTTPIVTFFRSYVANDYSATIPYATISQFVNIPLLIALGIVLLLNIVILWLFIYKNKKKTFYLFYTAYYLVLILFLFLIRSVLVGLEQSPLSPDIARVYQDVVLIVYVPQIFFVTVCAVRALGFNIKQFNFSKDYKDLDITTEDNAEVEVSFGLDTYKAKRGFKRFKREFGYYLKENTFMVVLLSIVGIGVGIYLLLIATNDYTDYYRLGDKFTFGSVQLSIDDAIITNLDAGGNKIAKNKYYVLLKVTATNNTIKNESFDYNNIKLYYSKTDYLSVTPNVSKYFVDYGMSTDSRTVNAQTSKTFVLPFEIDSSMIKSNFEVKLYTGVTSKSNMYYVTTAVIKINPVVFDEVNTLGSINYKNTLNLANTNLLNTNFTIDSYEITDKFMYSYNYCISKNNCRDYKDIVSRTTTTETILVLKGKLELDSNSIYSQTKNAEQKFVDNFLKLEYTKNGTKYNSSVVNVTPQKFEEGYILKTDSKIVDAETINLLVTVRNKRYNIVLKS